VSNEGNGARKRSLFSKNNHERNESFVQRILYKNDAINLKKRRFFIIDI
jgi:hypothetical protein